MMEELASPGRRNPKPSGEREMLHVHLSWVCFVLAGTYQPAVEGFILSTFPTNIGL